MSKEILEIIKPVKEAVVNVLQEYNITMESEENSTEFQLILSEQKDVVVRDEIFLILSDSGNKIYNLVVSPNMVKKCSCGNGESLDHSEIMKEFAKHFRMEHVHTVQKVASGYI